MGGASQIEICPDHRNLIKVNGQLHDLYGTFGTNGWRSRELDDILKSTPRNHGRWPVRLGPGRCIFCDLFLIHSFILLVFLHHGDERK